MSQMAPPQSFEDPRIHLSRPDALYEVVDGQIKEKPEMGYFAILVTNRILAMLRPFVESRGLGTVVMEMIFVLDAARPLKRCPDVAFVSADRWPLDKPGNKKGDWEVVPDLAIEVISPSDVEENIHRKLLEYFDAGVRQVWHVRPLLENVTVYRSLRDVKIYASGDMVDVDDLLPGFRMPLDNLFRASPG